MLRLYNQSISKKTLYTYLFRGYLFDNYRKQVKLVRRYAAKRFKQYYYLKDEVLEPKKLVYDLEHKSDVMISGFMSRASIHAPMEIAIRQFLYEGQDLQQVSSSLWKYASDVSKFFAEFDYFMRIFEGNFRC